MIDYYSSWPLVEACVGILRYCGCWKFDLIYFFLVDVPADRHSETAGVVGVFDTEGRCYTKANQFKARKRTNNNMLAGTVGEN